MAIITISRRIASYGDETAEVLAEILGYKFITRKTLEQKLLERGMAESMLKKYDERKPNFWDSISRERDFYLDILRETVFEEAKHDNRIFIGRGGFAILKDIPSCYRVRLVASDTVRLKRLMAEFNWNENQARQRLNESDQNRDGFHKCFFNVQVEDPAVYDIVLNTNSIKAETAAEIIKSAFEKSISKEMSEKTHAAVSRKLLGQKIVNAIAFEHKLPIYFLDAEVSENEIKLHGISESGSDLEKAIEIAKVFAGKLPINSQITFVSSYKSNMKHLKA